LLDTLLNGTKRTDGSTLNSEGSGGAPGRAYPFDPCTIFTRIYDPRESLLLRRMEAACASACS
jgi:hypothetical protein